MELAGYGPSLVAVVWVFQVVAMVFVTLRMAVRMHITKATGRDDWTMLLALALSALFTCMITVAALCGTGQRWKTLMSDDSKDLSHTLLINTITQATALYSFTISKLSIAFLLVRIFNPNVWLRTAFYFFPTVLILICFATTFIIFFQCDPVRGQWTLDLKPVTTCWDPSIYASLGYCIGSLAAFIDLSFAIYPAVICARLHMSARKKFGLACLFSLGFVAAAVTIYKTTLLSGLMKVKDVTYAIAKIFLWTSVEANIVIIAGSMPTLQPLIRSMRHRKDRPSKNLGPSAKPNDYYKISANNRTRCIINRDEHDLVDMHANSNAPADHQSLEDEHISEPDIRVAQ